MAPRRPRAPVLLSLILLGSACAPRPATRGGREIDALYDVFSAIAAVVFVVTASLILWSMLRYRRRRGEEDRVAPQTHSKVWLEVVWFAIPQLIVVGLFLLSLDTLWGVDADEPPVETGDGANPLVVEVEAFQWGWRFTFPDAGVEVVGTAHDEPEILLPVGVPIVFELRSVDVIHAFYVPRFLTKRDLIPGYENELRITIEDEGTYDGKCAEFCGLLHGSMNFSITAVPDDDFRAWLETGGTNG